MEWINTEDELPEHNDVMCLIVYDGEVEFARFEDNNNGIGFTCWESGYRGSREFNKVSHWCHLPKPPKQ